MGDPFEKVAAERRFDEIFGEEIGEYEGEIVLGQRVRLTAAEGVLRGNINWRSCQGDNCNMPEDWPFEILLPAGSVGQDTAGDALHQSPLGDAADPAGEGLLGLILVAIGWGLLALLTPCVSKGASRLRPDGSRRRCTVCSSCSSIRFPLRRSFC